MIHRSRRWRMEDDQRLIEMFVGGKDLREMAKQLDRSKDAVSMRRLKLQREGKCPTS